MGHLDTTIKDLARFSLTDLIRWLMPQVQILSLVEMPQELPATLRRVDILGKVLYDNSGPEMMVLESQAQRDPLLQQVMFLRAALVRMHYGLPVTSLLLALTPEAAIPEEFVYGRWRDRPLVHGVEVHKLYEDSADEALRSAPAGLVPLVPVMRPDAGEGDRPRVLAQVIERITAMDISPERKKQFIGWAATFATINLNKAQVDVIVRDVVRRRSFMLNALQDLPLLRDTYQEGLEKGIEKGTLKGQAQAVLNVLEARGVAVPEAARARILSCTDAALLKSWLLRAFTAAAADDLFV
jgi:hypothetical protein